MGSQAKVIFFNICASVAAIGFFGVLLQPPFVDSAFFLLALVLSTLVYTFSGVRKSNYVIRIPEDIPIESSVKIRNLQNSAKLVGILMAMAVVSGFFLIGFRGMLVPYDKVLSAFIVGLILFLYLYGRLLWKRYLAVIRV